MDKYNVCACSLIGMACMSALNCCATTKNDSNPNILLIVADDLGFSDIQPFGGEIRTPNLTRLSDNGVRFTRFHTSSLSAPTRAMLLTGNDNHQCGLGNMPPGHGENQYMQSGYEGYINDRAITIAEVLKENGYYTCMAGKWHLGALDGHTPDDKGFQNSFTMLAGGACHFANVFPLSESENPVTFYIENGKRIDKLPDDFYSSTDYTDKIMEYIDKCPADKPFFAYLAYTAPHDPLQVPDDWKDRYKGVYDCGYDSIRVARFARQQQMGIVSEDAEFPVLTGDNPKWEALSDEKKREQSAKMEIYASMVECMDYNIGRLLDRLELDGKLDNTIVIFMSDNGANPKEPYNYPGSSEEYIDKHYNNELENYGNPTSFISQGAAWAEISNTPYKRYKMTTNEGGICTPLIVSGKKFIKKSHIDTNSLLHVTDIVPTILELTNAKRPETRNGIQLAPLYGESFLTKLNSEINSNRTLCFEMIENKAVIRGDWKAVQLKKPYGDGVTWKLYNIKHDLSEEKDIANVYPEILKELITEWDKYSKSVGYIKSNGKSTISRIGSTEFYKYDEKNVLDEYKLENKN